MYIIFSFWVYFKLESGVNEGIVGGSYKQGYAQREEDNGHHRASYKTDVLFHPCIVWQVSVIQLCHRIIYWKTEQNTCHP